jgi:hypothetical protein
MKYFWFALAFIMVASTIALSYFALDVPKNIGKTTAEVASLHSIVIANTSGGKRERHYAKVRLQNEQTAKVWLPEDSLSLLGSTVPVIIMKSPLSSELNYQLDIDSYKSDK